MLTLLRDFYRFTKANKKLWMLPLLILLVSVGGVLIAANSAAIAPFIYALF